MYLTCKYCYVISTALYENYKITTTQLHQNLSIYSDYSIGFANLLLLRIYSDSIYCFCKPVAFAYIQQRYLLILQLYCFCVYTATIFIAFANLLLWRKYSDFIYCFYVKFCTHFLLLNIFNIGLKYIATQATYYKVCVPNGRIL